MKRRSILLTWLLIVIDVVRGSHRQILTDSQLTRPLNAIIHKNLRDLCTGSAIRLTLMNRYIYRHFIQLNATDPEF